MSYRRSLATGWRSRTRPCRLPTSTSYKTRVTPQKSIKHKKRRPPSPPLSPFRLPPLPSPSLPHQNLAKLLNSAVPPTNPKNEMETKSLDAAGCIISMHIISSQPFPSFLTTKKTGIGKIMRREQREATARVFSVPAAADQPNP